MLKRTALYEQHLKQGAVMVDYAGFELPLQYPTGILAEHHAVRTRAGLFDVSHMGQFVITGASAAKALSYVVSAEVESMRVGQVRYAILPNRHGGAVDDVLIYRHGSQRFLLVVNAANIEKDLTHIKNNLYGSAQIEDISAKTALLALQGPLSIEILIDLAGFPSLPKKYFTFVENADIRGIPCTISRTGYTGEQGYEIFCNNKYAPALYETLITAGAQYGLVPVGLGARDTLRLEAGMPLYGHELTEEYVINEVGLPGALRFEKEDFLGKEAILTHIPVYTRVGAVLQDRGIAREGAKIYAEQKYEVGFVTSGTHGPSVGKAIAMLRVKTDALDEPLTVEVRGKHIPLEIVPFPFDYKGR